MQLSRLHMVNQERAGFSVSLHVTDCSSCGNGELEAEVKSAGSGVEADVVGTWSHIYHGSSCSSNPSSVTVVFGLASRIFRALSAQSVSVKSFSVLPAHFAS